MHEVVTVVVEMVLLNVLVVRVRVIVDVVQNVTCAGLVVTVRVKVELGIVMVEAFAVAEKTLVSVVVTVAEGVDVTVNVAVGVDTTVTGGAAMMENCLM